MILTDELVVVFVDQVDVKLNMLLDGVSSFFSDTGSREQRY